MERRRELPRPSVEYRLAHQRVNSLCRRDKKRHLNSIVSEIRDSFETGKSGKTYRLLKTYFRGRKKTCSHMNDSIAASYLGNLYMEQTNLERDISFPWILGEIDIEDNEPTIQEVSTSICSLAKNKALDINNLCAEMLQQDAKMVELAFLDISRFWLTEEAPDDWKSSKAILIYKKGSAQAGP